MLILMACLEPGSDIEPSGMADGGLGVTAKKKNGIFWEFFPKGGGGHPISQNFCKITKSFLACQIHPKVLKHVFHTGGSNI